VSEQAQQTETRCEILRHAVRLFSHYGYSKTNIGDIAKACRMSSGNLYRYFRNKQAIGEEAVRKHMAMFETRMAVSLDETRGDFETRLRAMIHCGIGDIIEALREDPKIVELATMICESDSGILRRHVEWINERIASLLREGMDEGDLRDGDADMLASIVHDALAAFWNPVTLVQCELDKVPNRVDAILTLMLDGMRHPGP